MNARTHNAEHKISNGHPKINKVETS